MKKLMIAATAIVTVSPTYAGNIFIPPSDTYVYNYVDIYTPPPYVIQAPPQIVYRYVQPGRDPQTGDCYNLDLC